MITRRTLWQAAALGPFFASGNFIHAANADPLKPAPNTLLWYSKPAAEWTEATPIGNGRLGAMVFGGGKRERLQLNENTFWSGGPYHNVNPEARAALPKVRELIFAGKYAEAEAFAEEHMCGVPMREMSFQSIGDFYIDHADLNDTGVDDYRRELDLDAAITTTRFAADGATCRREIFASSAHNVIVISITADKKPVSVDLSFASGQRVAIEANAGELVMRGVNNEDRGIPGRLAFVARAKAVADGGTVMANGPVLSIRGSRSATVILAMATSYRSPTDVSGNPDDITRALVAKAATLPLASLRDLHTAEHRRLFRRVALDLGAGPGADQPTNQRIEHAADRIDPSLAALYFQYARYLLISSSRPGTEPANLQGIWNDSNRPPWGSKYTININTEMNYWPADTANLGECFEPLTAMVEQLAVSGARTAKDIYGARGWVAHHNTDLWRASGPTDHVRTGLWPTGGAWLCCQLWDHWDFQRDATYLKRIYPLMRGAALFFLDSLVRDPNTGHMVTNPSLSPENEHPYKSTLCAGPTMDMEILRDLFDRTVAAATALNADAELRAEIAAMRAKLAPLKIGKNGQLQEWQEDWDGIAPEIHHRHVSHLYGLYPSQQINADDTPALVAAARKSLETRGDAATGWGLAWRINLWARLRQGDHAHKLLITLLSPGRTYPNMFDAHPPFQIDGNFGGAAGILEMLVQSRGDRVDLLPALPAQWPTGYVRGMRIRGARTLDLTWRDGRVVDVAIRADHDGKIVLHAGNASATASLKAGRLQRFSAMSFR